MAMFANLFTKKSIKTKTTSPNRRQRGMMGMSDSMIQILFMVIMGTVVIAGAGFAMLSHARSVKFYEAGSQLANNWKNISAACGVSTDLSIANLTGTASVTNNLALLVDGPTTTTPVVAQYKACYKMSSVPPLNDMIEGVSGAYIVEDRPMTVSTVTQNGAKRTQVQFTNMSDDDTIALLGKYSSDATLKSKDPLLAADTDTDDPKINFSGAIDARTVKLLF